MAETFTIEPRGAFSLAEAAGFGFGPRAAEQFSGTLRLAFCRDDFAGHAGVALTQDAGGVVHATCTGGGSVDAVRAQTARVLSLDGDGAAWLERLHAIAQAAIDGELSPARLHELGPRTALEELQLLSGIGSFYASLIVVRASGFFDVEPFAETTILQAAQLAYGVDAALNHDAVVRISERWRPFRVWAAVLLRVAHSRAT